MMPQATQVRAKLVDVLETARRELLDLGLRNPLLNYRPLKAKGVEIIDEKASEVFRILVRNEKSMTFVPGTSSLGSEADEFQLGQPENGDEASTSRPHRPEVADQLYVTSFASTAVGDI